MITVYRVLRDNKLDKLLNVLIEIDNETYREGTIIFVKESSTADFLAAVISEMICPATSVHGSLSAREVRDSLQQYDSRDVPILVATSADHVNCSHIINFDVPSRQEEYAQRIGRTNQIGKKPNVTTFFESTDTNNTSIGEVFNCIVEASEGLVLVQAIEQ